MVLSLKKAKKQNLLLLNLAKNSSALLRRILQFLKLEEVKNVKAAVKKLQKLRQKPKQLLEMQMKRFKH